MHKKLLLSNIYKMYTVEAYSSFKDNHAVWCKMHCIRASKLYSVSFAAPIVKYKFLLTTGKMQPTSMEIYFEEPFLTMNQD